MKLFRLLLGRWTVLQIRLANLPTPAVFQPAELEHDAARTPTLWSIWSELANISSIIGQRVELKAFKRRCAGCWCTSSVILCTNGKAQNVVKLAPLCLGSKLTDLVCTLVKQKKTKKHVGLKYCTNSSNKKIKIKSQKQIGTLASKRLLWEKLS